MSRDQTGGSITLSRSDPGCIAMSRCWHLYEPCMDSANCRSTGVSPQVEQVLRSSGCARAQNFSVCVQAAHVVYTEAGHQWSRDDAAANCGNCLCERAELAPAAERMPFLRDALACYDGALQGAVGDAEV
jgi:hypothetical protein